MQQLNELIHGLSYEQYAALEGLRASELQAMRRSPAHYRWEKQNPKEPTDAQKFGILVHSMLENGEGFLSRLTVQPAFTGYTKDGKESAQSGEAREKKARWMAELPKGAVVVTKQQLEDLTGIARAVSRHRVLAGLMKDGTREAVIRVKDPETGLILKIKPDLIARAGFIVDFKSTIDASQQSFMKAIFSEFSYLYVLSAAHYNHVAKIAGLSKQDSLTLAAIEKTPPYGINVFPLDIGCLGPGEQFRAKLTRQYAECLEKDEWPGYSDKALQVVPPQWASIPSEFE